VLNMSLWCIFLPLIYHCYNWCLAQNNLQKGSMPKK
jgi:hypothetical protein